MARRKAMMVAERGKEGRDGLRRDPSPLPSTSCCANDPQTKQEATTWDPGDTVSMMHAYPVGPKKQIRPKTTTYCTILNCHGGY